MDPRACRGTARASVWPANPNLPLRGLVLDGMHRSGAEEGAEFIEAAAKGEEARTPASLHATST